MKWFIKCIQNYVTFKGRARRKEYWMFSLFSVIFMIIAILLDLSFFGSCLLFPNPIQCLFGLFIFLPQLAVMVRRLHDTNRSGKILLWYYLASIIWCVVLVVSGFSFFATAMSGQFSGMPLTFAVSLIAGGVVFFVWGILFLVWCCQRGTVGANQYGSDPKAVEE